MEILKLFVCLLAAAPVLTQNSTELPTTTAKITTTSAKPASIASKLISSWISVLSDADKMILKALVINDDFNATRDVSFVLYTPNNPTTGHNLTTTNVNSSNFNPSYPTRVVIHGWQNNVNSSVNIMLKDAYLKRGNFNVICVNWANGADELDYIVVWNRLPFVAAEVIKMLKFLIASSYVRLDDLLLVGHSLGAHTCGLVGKQIPGIRAIVGLDPAEPLFFKDLPEKRLASTDALVVQVVHTSAFGLQYNVGTADFYADKGLVQPGCSDLSCSHSRAYFYFAESITGPNKFNSTKCSSLWYYIFNLFGVCKKSSAYLFGGEPLIENLAGSYYFEVNKNSPYGQG